MRNVGVTGRATVLTGLIAIAAAGAGYAAKRLSGAGQSQNDAAEAEGYDNQKTILISKSPQELMGFCQDPANLAAFMKHVSSIVAKDDGTLVWSFQDAPIDTADKATSFRIDHDRSVISWKTDAGVSPAIDGELSFEQAPGDRGSYVSLTNDYTPARTSTGGLLGTVTGFDAKVQARHDLKRLKMLVETGEIATSAYTNDSEA